MRTLERAFNRARIPIAYTQGFNRRPRMSLAAALPLGFTSVGELADIWLVEFVEPNAAQKMMMSKMAPGIMVHGVEEVPLSAPSLQSILSSASYEVSIAAAEFDCTALNKGIERMLAAESWPMQRRRGRGKKKNIDLRPLILKLQLLNRRDDCLIEMELIQNQTKTGRPDDVLAALAIDPHESLIMRTKMSLSESNG
jgi:radical SAM-linked protein